jgi:two-component system response regulator DegU
MSLNVLLVDDHKIMRDGIKAILRHSDEFHVMAEAESGSEAVQICKKQRPDIVLMDIGLPGLNGIETTTELLRLHPTIKIIILSMYDDEHSVVGAIRSGARAFVLKKASDGDLVDALRTVAKGGSYLSPQVSDRLLHRIQRGDLDSAKPLPSALDVLSPRELQVLRLVAEGKTSKEIAWRSDRTQLPKNHDEKTRRQQRSRLNPTGPRFRHHAFPNAGWEWPTLNPEFRRITQLIWTPPGVNCPSPMLTSISSPGISSSRSPSSVTSPLTPWNRS